MYRIALTLAMFAAVVSAQTKKVVVASSAIYDELKDLSSVPGIRLVNPPADRLNQELADADGFVGDITPDQVKVGKKLRWVQTRSAGVEKLLHLSGSNALRDSNIILTNNQVVQGPEIADHAMGMLLMLTRGLNLFWEQKKQEVWQARPGVPIELMGRNAVVIGVGGIGMGIALRAWAHGMNVVGVDPDDKPFLAYIKRMVPPDKLDEVIPDADVVFVSAPWTPESQKMMGAKQFANMKKGSYFIAVSRGGLYDLDALVKALDSKQLAGAGVDVTDPEPLPKGHALWKFENAVITPHMSGRSDKDAARMTNTIRENIKRFAEGKPLINVVDKAKGW